MHSVSTATRQSLDSCASAVCSKRGQLSRRGEAGRPGRTRATLVRVDVSALVARVLDPVLTASIFTAGQTGLDPDDASSNLGSSEGRRPEQSGSVIWCAPYEAVQQKYPSLPQARGHGIGTDYACVDLTVTIDRGSITEVDFEGLSLAETFSALGRHEEARAADRLLGTSAQTATAALAELLATLFEPTVD
jgi:hypothetical protein